YSRWPGASRLGDPRSSDPLRKHEEPNLLCTDPSKFHRFRLVGCPRFNGLQPRRTAPATTGHGPRAVKAFPTHLARSCCTPRSDTTAGPGGATGSRGERASEVIGE